VISKKWKDTSADTISEITNRFEASSFDPEELNEIFSAFLKEKELGMGAVLPLLRVLLSGKGTGPSLFDIMAFLGKQESIARLKDGVQSLSNG
jgi:glutamyl-tRNA synthetase